MQAQFSGRYATLPPAFEFGLKLKILCIAAYGVAGLTLFDFLGRSVDQHVEGPDHARDGDDVEGDRTHDLPPFAGCHLQLLPLRRESGHMIAR